MSVQPGSRLGPYEILGPLGAGGMGEVWHGRDTRLGRDIALKFIPEALALEPERLARFEREAKLLASLNHPNIVTIYSIERRGSTRFLTMELVQGQSLDRMVRAGGLSVPQVLEIGAALADALSAAHERGVVHRDLKPANVMVAKDGRVKVLDFGLAKLAEGARENLSEAATRLASLTHEGGVPGTAPYMSPERLRAESVDHRSDLFSLGVVLYELATGSRPFAGKNAAELVSSILRDEPVPVTVHREDLPRHLGRIIMHCLQKDPQERFQTARDVCNELRQLREEVKFAVPVSTSPAGVKHELAASPGSAAVPPASLPTTGERRITTRRPVARSLWIALAGVGLLITGTAVGWFVLSERGSKPGAGEAPASASPETPRADATSLAVLPFVNMSGDEENEYFSDGLAEELLNALAKNPALRVAARTSSFSFKGKDAEIAEIGRKLNVTTVLEGSVRKVGNRVRITVQLVNAADGYHLWSETYDRQLEDIFAVQDEIARSVTTSLKAALEGSPAGKRTGNTEAYNLVLKGKHFSNLGRAGDLQKAKDLFQQALALEPNNARAWLELGNTYYGLVERGKLSSEEGVDLARRATERSLALDESSGEAHSLLCWIKLTYDWDLAEAGEELRKAQALEPENSHVLTAAATLLSAQGRLREANEVYRRLHQIDPLTGHHNHAILLLREGRLDEALAVARENLEFNPQYPGARSLIGQVYLASANPEAALREIQQEPDEQARLYALVLAYHALGRTAESDAALATYVEKYSDNFSFGVAKLHARRAESDKAFEWLERAYARRARGLIWIKANPELDNLRNDPRWLPFLRKMRLEN